MKNLLIIAFVLVIASCSNTNKEEHKSKENVRKHGTGEQAKEFDKYEATFICNDKEQHINQKLGVTWITSDSIEFRLLTEDEICDSDYWGSAKNNYPENDPEIDEDENGVAYSSHEYLAETKDYILQIKIGQDRKKARILYNDKTGETSECQPPSELSLVRK